MSNKTKMAQGGKKKWWSEGIRFECQKSGQCCTSHGEYGYVYMTLEDRKLMAKGLGLSLSEFTKKYCEKTDGIYHLIERKDNPDCLFFKKGRCSVYLSRPMQCRTWPFWPENMNAKTWNKEIKTFCPGVGKGPLRKPEDIEAQLKAKKVSDLELGT